VAELLKKQIGPAIQISGMVYPPSPINSLLATLCSWLFILGLVVMFAGEHIFNALHFAPGQRLCQLIKQNQSLAMVLLFACHWMSSQLISTGAFEVFYNDQLVFSKLATGELPNPNELVYMANKHSTLPSNSY